MLPFLFRLHDLDLFLLLSCISIIVSLIAISLVKWWMPLAMRYRDNGVIGNASSIIAVIYGVLAGFSALYLINNNNYASDAVQKESNAIADIYRDSKWLKDPSRVNIQNEIKNYLNQVINVEWPLMRSGSEVDDFVGSLIIERISNELINYSGVSDSELLLVHDMMDEIRNLYDSRGQRIHMSYSELSPELWIVILIGTILTLCINYLFGMNFYLHIVTITAVAIMTSSMIFLLITLDRPFQGEFAIEPDAFRTVLKLIMKSDENHVNHREIMDKSGLHTP